MNCERVKEVFAEYLTADLQEGLKAEMEAHLAECAKCRDETRSSQALWAKLGSLPTVEPSPGMDARFRAMLVAERRKFAATSETVSLGDWFRGWVEPWWPRQTALQFGLAILFFAVGLVLGPMLPSLRRGEGSSATDGERAVAQLREEVSGLKQMVALTLLQQPSASERLRGVDWSGQLPAPDEQVLAALLRALDADPNVNVRLAAVDALQRYSDREMVKQALLTSLPRQNSPLVQMELIRLLVTLKARDSAPVLKALLENSDCNPTVRQSAEWGLNQL